MRLWADYWFWLVIVSLVVFAIERVRPWRRDQRVLRRGIWQDLFWLVFNGHFLGVLLALAARPLTVALNDALRGAGLPAPEALDLLASAPFAIQLVVFFVVQDFIEWNLHRLLHRVPWLWEFHKLHHSIEELDWIGNFRFHWGEVIFYRTMSYLPIVALGADSSVVLTIAVFGTLVQDLNHANVRADWGFLRYVFNSPRMHVWHHDVEQHGPGGQNFGIVLSIWDWLFGTVYWPDDPEGPERLGFTGMEHYPRSLAWRFLYPLSRLW